jgi:hypothetical protein
MDVSEQDGGTKITISNDPSLRVCFILACKYYRNYESLIPVYVENICNFYSNALIILVDNNSNYFDDIRNQLAHHSNVVILMNNTPCKFELGAYKVGVAYLLNNHIQDIDYVFFTQDNYIIKNRLDLNMLKQDRIMASALFAFLSIDPLTQANFYSPTSQHVLRKIGLQDSIHKLALCWCHSFVLHFSNIGDFFEITKDIVIVNRSESNDSERYLSGILYYLNDYRISQIDDDTSYQTLSFEQLKSYTGKQYFIKFHQSKTEQTLDI